MRYTIRIFGIIFLAAIIIFSITACNRSGRSSSASSVSTAGTEVSRGASSLAISEMDRFLDDFEKFLDDFVKLMSEMGPLYQKLMAGDFSVAAQIEEFQPRFDAFTDNYEDFGKRYERLIQEWTLTAFNQTQLNRFSQITTKYSEAMAANFGQ